MQPSESDKKHTHFGFREVATDEKANLVAEVFHSVASRYDLMNDLMSLGLHRFWKQYTIRAANVRPGQMVLDVAAGTGDLTKAFVSQVGAHGKVIMTDINDSMLQLGRDRLADHGVFQNVEFVQADAEKLPFADNCFDCATIGFGLRNVTRQMDALYSFYKVLKPGGKLLILEFSQPTIPLFNKIYDFYSFNIIPKIGGWVANDRTSYQYLVESIRRHPNQEALKKMLQESGFEDVEYTNLNGGIVAIHKGYKY